MGKLPGGLRRRTRTAVVQTAARGTPPPARSLLAAAMPLEGTAGRQAWQARSGDDGWQKQAWYFYDAVGELRFAFNYLANAVSRATLYAAEIDPETGLVTGPTEDARAQAAVTSILGGADDRPQLQSTMMLHWQVAGETFILVIPQAGAVPDRWVTLSASAIRVQGGTWSYRDPLTGVWTRMRQGTDRLIRIWSPHPEDQTHADSAMRAAIPILQEVEKTSQNIIARLDSRLAGNGILFLPQELDFPTQEGEPANAENFMALLMEAAEASIAQPGTAAAQIPIMAQIPAELFAQLGSAHMDLATAMDSAITELREQALTRVGRTLDMPREVAMGTTAEANHWSAWQVEETTYKIHLEPPLLKLAMALTKEWFRPALAAMGITDPDRFVLAWDVTEIIKRPDDKEDVKYLFENNLVSVDYVLSKFGVPDDARPSDDESRFNLARTLVINAPSTLENASVAELLGLEPTVSASAPQAVDGPVDDGTVRALPQRAARPEDGPDEGLVAAAELVAFDALSRAGGRLLTRQYRGQFASTPKWELHTVIPQDGRENELMEGSFQFTDNIAHAFNVDPRGLRMGIQAYVRNRLQWGAVHEREILARYIAQDRL